MTTKLIEVEQDEVFEDVILYIVNDDGKRWSKIISPRFEEWLKELGWVSFTASDEPTLERCRRRFLHLISVHDLGEGDDIICHFRDQALPWWGSITICKEVLEQLFGHVPNVLYLSEVTEEATECPESTTSSETA